MPLNKETKPNQSPCALLHSVLFESHTDECSTLSNFVTFLSQFGIGA